MHGVPLTSTRTDVQMNCSTLPAESFQKLKCSVIFDEDKEEEKDSDLDSCSESETENHEEETDSESSDDG